MYVLLLMSTSTTTVIMLLGTRELHSLRRHQDALEIRRRVFDPGARRKDEHTRPDRVQPGSSASGLILLVQNISICKLICEPEVLLRTVCH